jgi:hypothetical protein
MKTIFMLHRILLVSVLTVFVNADWRWVNGFGWFFEWKQTEIVGNLIIDTKPSGVRIFILGIGLKNDRTYDIAIWIPLM